MRLYTRVGGAVVLGALLIGVAAFSSSSNPESQAGTVVIATEPRAYQEVVDKDSDGLPDWEENLLGSDPLTKNERPTPQAQATQEEPLTSTDLFSRQFFGEYLSRKGSGETFTDTEKESFIKRSLSNMGATAPKEPVFTEADILISTDTAPESVRAYGNALGSALLRNPVENENEAVILKRAIDSENEDELRKLDPIIFAYTQMVEDVRALSVPTSMKQEHLSLLNALLSLKTTIIAMRGALHDPMPALMRLRGYAQEVERLQAALVAQKTAFATQQVVFTNTEMGYALTGE